MYRDAKTSRLVPRLSHLIRLVSSLSVDKNTHDENNESNIGIFREVFKLNMHPRNAIAIMLSFLLLFGLAPSDGLSAKAAGTKPRIVDIAIGDRHVLALDSEGGVWSWGRIAHGFED